MIQSQVVSRVSAPIYFKAGRLDQQLQGKHDRLWSLPYPRAALFVKKKLRTSIVEKFRGLRKFYRPRRELTAETRRTQRKEF